MGVSNVVVASAGAPAGRPRGSGTDPGIAPPDAIAKLPGRCRGSGTRPRTGSSVGTTSTAAIRAGGGEGGAGDGLRRDEVKLGGLAEFGLGQAIA